MRQPIAELWYSRTLEDWQQAIAYYWTLVRPENLDLERSMEHLDLERIRALSPEEWYTFLHNQYFRWKYTAPNRYASTTAVLRRKAEGPAGGASLHKLLLTILAVNPKDARLPLEEASKIPGLGTAGASGLLALFFPTSFGTVDQFVVKALRLVPNLPDAGAIAKMHPEGLAPRDGEILIKIMRRQAEDLTSSLGSVWRPRDVDKVLWTYGRG